MPIVRQSVIVARSCATMFALVDRVEDYPQFLPWCSRVELLERTAEVTSARIHIDYHGLATHVATRNAKQEPRSMTLALVEGPFESFGGTWNFRPLGDSGCRVEFALEYAFSSRVLEAVLGPAFGHITQTLVDRFVARAEAGESP
jgi:ribosome-associated toxin RatA of RatAB toxin-antitoxin module